MFVSGGSVKVSVPTGTYAAIGLLFGGAFRLIQDAEFEVTDDQTLRLDGALATSRVGVRMPGASVRDLSSTLDRSAAGGGGISWTLLGGGALVQPSRDVETGSLTSQVSSDLVLKRARGDSAAAPTTASTVERQQGVPADQVYRYRRSDFAVVDASYAAGATERGSGLATFRFLPGQIFDFQTVFPVDRPSHRTELLLGNPRITWNASCSSTSTSSPSGSVWSTTRRSRCGRAGT